VILNPARVPDFRVYDDVDAVSDLPTAWFYEELMEAYPGLKCIHTVRNEDAWWNSIERHFNVRYKSGGPGSDPLRSTLRRWVYGSEFAVEYLYRRRYREHNERVRQKVPQGQFLEMDVTAGHGWAELCPFLDVAIPAAAFPHENSSSDDATRLRSTAEDIERFVGPEKRYILVDQDHVRHSLDAKASPLPVPSRDGIYWGLPANDEDLISEIESILAAGIEHVVIAWPAFWWLEHYQRFSSYLASRFHRVCENERVVVFQLRSNSA
jgi:hypothetical protein